MVGLVVNDPAGVQSATIENEQECNQIANAVNHVGAQAPGKDGKRVHAWCAEIEYLTLEAPLHATELP